MVLSSVTLQAQASTAPKQPNILVIIADDLGFSDIQSYNSEIPTPYLDELAKQGVSFTNFFVSPYSSPSHAMFLTGADPHQVRLGNIYTLNTPEQLKSPNYVGHLTDNSVTIAECQNKQGTILCYLANGIWVKRQNISQTLGALTILLLCSMAKRITGNTKTN